MFTMFNEMTRGDVTDSSDSDLDEIESMYEGQAETIFSRIDESIVKIDNFLTFERSFLHGDIVSPVNDPSGQLGRIIHLDVSVDLEDDHAVTLKDINNKDLIRTRPFCSGDYVIHGPWLGVVDRVTDLLTVAFEDGAVCEIEKPDPVLLAPVPPNLMEDSGYFYYPGQHVKSRVSNVLKNARYLSGEWNRSRCEAVVKHVDVQSVCVNWIVSLSVVSNINFPRPTQIQNPNALTLLIPFPHANWQLGDYCLFSSGIKPEDCDGENKRGRAMPPKHHLVQRKPEFEDEQAFVVVGRKVKVDVLWQDGSVSTGLDPNTLCSVSNICEHDFLPEDVVLAKSSDEDGHDSCGKKMGIVRSVDAKERTVKVKWMNNELDNGLEPWRKISEEIVSAYELMDHPDYCYCLGDMVCRFQFQCLEGLNLPSPLDTLSYVSVGKEVFQKQRTLEACKESVKSSLSCFGYVSDYKDGTIVVTWADGVVSKVGPLEIIAINREQEKSSVSLLDTEYAGNNVIAESHKCDDYIRNKDVKEGTSNDSALCLGTNCRNYSCKRDGLSIPRATLGFLTKIASSIFGSQGYAKLSKKTQSGCSRNIGDDCNLEMGNLYIKDGNGSGFICKPTREENEVDAIKKNQTKSGDISVSIPGVMSEYVEAEYEEVPLLGGPVMFNKFHKFDIIEDFSDHHFRGRETNLCRKQGWLKKISQEWAILEKDLPDTIFVRVYEERIDLLRAAISGAAGTPYHDGLFFFDIFISPDYPHQPPLVHYISGGLQLNPNLYESGHVCLSLLNTWSGTGNEIWNPGRSTILQVLLSLQALVLNAKPYFNEAGYDKQMGKPEGEKNSITYNENAFLLSCKSMLYLLQKPPKNFEALVEEHFQSHARSLLMACKSYRNGSQVGQLSEDWKTSAGGDSYSSAGFRLMIDKLFPKLVSAFSDKGIDCSTITDTEIFGF